MKVFVQIVDTKTGIFQSGMIDEPVSKGFEVMNAINHFIKISDIDWVYNGETFKCGKIKDTTKVVSIICLQGLDQ